MKSLSSTLIIPSLTDILLSFSVIIYFKEEFNNAILECLNVDINLS